MSKHTDLNIIPLQKQLASIRTCITSCGNLGSAEITVLTILFVLITVLPQAQSLLEQTILSFKHEV